MESHTLATLRDRLLPKLLSGELRIDGVQRAAQVTDMVKIPIRANH